MNFKLDSFKTIMILVPILKRPPCIIIEHWASELVYRTRALINPWRWFLLLTWEEWSAAYVMWYPLNASCANPPPTLPSTSLHLKHCIEKEPLVENGNYGKLSWLHQIHSIELSVMKGPILRRLVNRDKTNDYVICSLCVFL